MAAMRIPPEVFFLDRGSGRSLQSQIRASVVASILSGAFAPGAWLPSSRGLARHLGVARMTVTLAYQELVAQGYLGTERRSGYVVAALDHPVKAAPRPARRAPIRAVDWDAILPGRLLSRRTVRKPADWRRYPFPFVYGQIDTSLFDHSAWRDCARQAMGRRDFDDMAGDLVEADDPLLVNYICNRTLKRRGISARADEVLVTVGAQNALWLVIGLLTRRPLRAACENPGYPDTAEALRWAGAEITPVPIDAGGLPPERIPQGTDAVFVTPSHHAPTGATMPMERRHRLLSDAESRDFLIVEDDYEFEMSFLEPPSPALKSLDEAGRVLYAGSFSKALFPGLRLGYLVGPPAFIAEARALRAMILRHPSGHQQRTAAYFLAQGHYDRHIRVLRDAYHSRRSVLQAALAPTDIEIAGAARFGGSSLWLRAPDCIDTTALAEELLRDGVVIEAGAPFFDRPSEGRRFFRLGYSSIAAARIPDGVLRISAAVERIAAAS